MGIHVCRILDLFSMKTKLIYYILVLYINCFLKVKHLKLKIKHKLRLLFINLLKIFPTDSCKIKYLYTKTS